MNTSKLKAAFSYQFKDSIRAAAAFFAVMLVIFIATFITISQAYRGSGRMEFASFSVETSTEDIEYAEGMPEGTASFEVGNSEVSVSGNFSAYGFAAIITLFVFGICTVRENLRVMLQCGVSRRTTFLSHLLSMLALCAAVAVAGELLIAIAQALAARYPGFVVTDLYQLFYVGFDVKSLSFVQHINGAVFIFAYCALAYLGGSFISLVFYRLNKFWRVVVGAGVPLMLSIGFPLLFAVALPTTSYFRPQVIEWIASALTFIFTVYWRMIIFVLLCCALVALFNWLLMRKAPIK